jgi:uncharacterized protein YdiU (UPF0061 family)
MTALDRLPFDNSYTRLHPAFYEVVEPTPLPDPYLVAFNPAAARLVDLDPVTPDDTEAVAMLCGNRRIPGAEAIAQAYAGHQFGVWVPQLGDGRAFLLGEVRGPAGASWDLHLKGGGRTRFSRFGDGRAVLRSVVREYLAGEALHGMGIPTTRSLCIVGSPLPVQRERIESAATLIRMAPSHVRFGSFEYFAARGERERVRELAGYVIARHYPDLADDPALSDLTLRRFFTAVTGRTAELLAHWIAAGFAHGVMNTDNMSILGLTLDYGPYGFLDEYDAEFICNHSDSEGRYSFGRQPAVGMWNCARLGDALLQGTAEPEAWQEALEGYWPAFATSYGALMRKRLGLATAQDDDADLIRGLLALLQHERRDYTRFFRALAGFDELTGSGGPERESAEAADWFARYAARLRAEGSRAAERRPRMLLANPKYVLRNWIAQEAIEEAEAGRFERIEGLRRLFADPCAEHPGMERYAEGPSGSAREIAVSCSS